MEADQAANPGRIRQNVVGAAIDEAMVMTAKMETEGLKGLLGFCGAHGSANEPCDRLDVSGFHRPNARGLWQ